MLTEVRHAARLLWRDGFTTVALITLSLGIGASTAMFSVVDRLVIQPLPSSAPGRLARVTVDRDGQQVRDIGLDVLTLFDLASRRDPFTDVSGLYPITSTSPAPTSRSESAFDRRGAVAARFCMPQPNDPSTGPYFRHEQRLPFYGELFERGRALPGVNKVLIPNP